MKSGIFVLTMLFVVLRGSAQDTCVKGKLYDYINQVEAFRSIVALNNDDYIAVGTSWNIYNGIYNLFIVKTNGCGDILWSRTFGLEEESYIATAAHFKPGNNFVMFSAIYYQYITAQYFYCVAKMNLEGDTLWMRKYWAGPQNSSPKSVVQTSDGGFAIVGFNQNFTNDYSKIWFIKTDSEGNVEWDKFYGTDSNSEGVEQVMQLPDGGYLILGRRTYSGTPTIKIWLIRTDAQGTVLWERLHGNNFATYGSHIIPVSDGYMLSGIQYAAPTWQISGDAYLLKTDINGYLQWQHTYGGLYSEHLARIMQLPDGNFICMGSNASWGTVDSPDGWLFKVSTIGDSIWSKTYRYDALVARSEYFYDFTSALDGGFMICGWAGQPAPTNQDAWIVRTDSLGNPCPPDNGCWVVGVSDILPPDPFQDENSILVYPNPAQNSLTFTLPEGSKSPSGDLGVTTDMGAGDLELTLLTLTGQTIVQTTLVSSGSTSQTTISVAHLPPGLYIYVVSGGVVSGGADNGGNGNNGNNGGGTVLARGKVAIVR